MGAFVAALAMLTWLWAEASLHVVRALAGRAAYPVRAAWLALMVMVGALALLSLVWVVLPDSFLSRGWTRELVQDTRQLSILFVLGTGAAGFLRQRTALAADAVQRL